MTKLTFTAATFSLAMLSLSPAAFAGGGHDKDAPHGASMNHGASVKHGASTKVSDDHASSLGKPGDATKVTRTIAVDMTDNMRFNPENVTVKKGETIKFVVKNSGRIKHEMVLGSMKELKEHGEMMRKMPEMEHADANQVTVDPGKTGELIWKFTKTGKFDFACLQPGHFEAGMKGKVAVK